MGFGTACTFKWDLGLNCRLSPGRRLVLSQLRQLSCPAEVTRIYTTHANKCVSDNSDWTSNEVGRPHQCCQGVEQQMSNPVIILNLFAATSERNCQFLSP